MSKKVNSWTLAGIVALGLSFGVVNASDLSDKCDECHGKNGNSKDDEVPNIAGMSAPYITDTITAYAEGDRPAEKYKPEGGEESDMAEVAKKLSDDDIASIADHYAGQEFMKHEQAHDAGMAAKGKKKFDKKCDKCHADGGTDPEDDAGLLLGQWKEYLKDQFEHFSSGKRSMPKKMKKKFKKLSDDDKAAILEYLASGK